MVNWYMYFLLEWLTTYLHRRDGRDAMRDRIGADKYKKSARRRFFSETMSGLFFAQCTKTLLEAINSTTGINVTLFTSIERVTS